MPGFAGSSGYYLRYMDPANPNEYFSAQANSYWQQVDLYMGGAEHATGHLIYARFWNMFLFDLGLTIKDEPFKKMINQGMIQGRSSLVYHLWEKLRNKGMGVAFERDFRDGHRKFDFFSPEAKLIIEVRRVRSLEKVVHPYADYASEKGYKILLIPTRDMLFEKETVFNKIAAAILGEEVPEFEEKPELQAIPVFASKNIEGREQFTEPIHVDISLVHNDILDIEAFKKWQPHLAEAVFLLEDDKYYCGWEVKV